MIKKQQRGFSTIFFLFIVTASLFFVTAIYEIGNRFYYNYRVKNAVINAAEAGAFSYGKSLFKNLDKCVIQEINNMINLNQDKKLSYCLQHNLANYLNIDTIRKFSDNENIDMNTCWNKHNSPIKKCKENNSLIKELKKTALNQARKNAKHILDTYNMNIRIKNFELRSESNEDKIHVAVESDYHSKISIYPLSGTINKQSAAIIRIK